MLNLQNISEQELITMVATGAEAPIAELVNRTKQRVYYTIYMLLKDAHLSEDFMQEVYIKAIEKLRNNLYQNDGKCSAWLCRIAHNMCMDHFRKSSKTRKVSLPDGMDIFSYLGQYDDAIENNMMNTQSGKIAKELLNHLPAEQKEVLMLRFFQDLSFAEIADEMNCSISTALGRARYGLINLRKLVKENELVL
jgi:RNA polymerase sigma factor (sigma-70 family)